MPLANAYHFNKTNFLQQSCNCLVLQSMNFKINWDALGITTSIACAIHCALLPLFISSLPLFGVNIIDNVAFEYGMILLAFVVGTNALYHGYKKHHHSLLPIILFSLGIIFLLAKQWLHQWQLWFLIPAVVLIVVAHFINYRYCRGHSHAHKEDCDH
jgi:hypothetical protein